MERSREALDRIRPYAAQDLDSAFARDPTLVRESAEGRPQRAIRAMQLEGQIWNNPSARADRFVARWKDLETQREAFHRADDVGAARAVKASMGEMAK